MMGDFHRWLSTTASFLFCLPVSTLGRQKLFGGRKPSHQGVRLWDDKVTQGRGFSRLSGMTRSPEVS